MQQEFPYFQIGFAYGGLIMTWAVALVIVVPIGYIRWRRPELYRAHEDTMMWCLVIATVCFGLGGLSLAIGELFQRDFLASFRN